MKNASGTTHSVIRPLNLYACNVWGTPKPDLLFTTFMIVRMKKNYTGLFFCNIFFYASAEGSCMSAENTSSHAHMAWISLIYFNKSIF